MLGQPLGTRSAGAGEPWQPGEDGGCHGDGRRSIRSGFGRGMLQVGCGAGPGTPRAGVGRERGHTVGVGPRSPPRPMGCPWPQITLGAGG